MGTQARRIGEVARRTGLTVRTLRHYDDLGLVVPSGRSSGDHRLYTPADVRRLLVVLQLRALGLGLREVRAALDDPAFDAAAALADHIAAVEEQLAVQRALLTRLQSLQGAARLGWDEVLAVAALTERLRHPEPAVRVRAALDGATSTPLDVLLDQLSHEVDDAVVETVTWAVGRHGPDAVGPVCERATDPDPRVRRRMVAVLAKLADGRSVPTLVAALADTDPGTVSMAVLGLGRIADPATLPPLVALVGGDDQETVGDAVARFGAAAVPPLTRALRHGGPAVRRHAAETLGAVGDRAAAPVLVEALADDDRAVRLAAVLALGRLPAGAADDALTRAVAADDPLVSAVAARLTARRPPAGRSR